MTSCVLFATEDKSVVLLDIPRSIELAQVQPGQKLCRRLVSCQPLEEPWQAQTQAQKRLRQPDMSQSASTAIDVLMVQGLVQGALEKIQAVYKGPWLLPRSLELLEEGNDVGADAARKRKRLDATPEHGSDKVSVHIPIGNHHLLGSIASQRDMFLRLAPSFDLVLMDPPWPSRSVRRKRDRYSTAYDMQEIRELLSLIPVADHLKPDGLVAIWVTNKPAVIALLQSKGGMFDHWGLETIGEWIWVKTTRQGIPIVDVESTWRKPWERLLIATRKGSQLKLVPDRKVILGVPDLHSRKPNLKKLFDELLPKDYLGLEVFSRNLTAGWWNWGDQTLMFQQKHHWVEDSDHSSKDQYLLVNSSS